MTSNQSDEANAIATPVIVTHDERGVVSNPVPSPPPTVVEVTNHLEEGAQLEVIADKSTKVDEGDIAEVITWVPGTPKPADNTPPLLKNYNNAMGRLEQPNPTLREEGLLWLQGHEDEILSNPAINKDFLSKIDRYGMIFLGCNVKEQRTLEDMRDRANTYKNQKKN